MDLPDDTDLYDSKVYERARQNLLNMEKNGVMKQDETPCYYIYELTRKGKTQTGLVGCCSIDDYMKGIVKKHELTREDKEQDRIRHVDVCDANTGPIYLACRYPQQLLDLMEQWKTSHAAVYDFVADDEIVKVHVHTNHPGQAIERALTYGSLSRMKIDNMREEHQEKLIKDAEKLAKQQAEEEKQQTPPKETGFIAVGTPVVLRGLQGCIHLVEPGTNQRGVRCLGGDNTLAAPKAAGEGTVLRGDIAGIGSQCGQGFPIGQVVDVGNIPAKADAVTTGLAFRNIGGPFLRKAFGVNEVFRIQLVQPVKTFTVALLSGRADNLQVIRDGNVAILIGITIALTKAIDQDTGILVTVVDNAGHRDDIALNAKLTLDGIRVVAESDQYLLKFIYRRRHLQTQEIQPLLVDEAHISHRLDRRLFSAQLLDPRQRPNMSLGICTHGTVLRVHLKNLLEVGICCRCSPPD